LSGQLSDEQACALQAYPSAFFAFTAERERQPGQQCLHFGLRPGGTGRCAFQRSRARQVFVLPDDNPIHQRFAKEVLGVYPYQLRAAWDRMVYSGTGPAPIQVNTFEEMIERLRTTPGAIGYVLSGTKP
jgi:hypothetical protein